MTCMWLYIDIMIGKRLYAVGVLVAYPLKQAELLGGGYKGPQYRTRIFMRFIYLPIVRTEVWLSL